MKTPMVLPWLARRAGVDDGRAEALWRIACHQAGWMTVGRDRSSFWGAALQLLCNLLACENQRMRAAAFWHRLAPTMVADPTGATRCAFLGVAGDHAVAAGLACLALPWLLATTSRRRAMGR
ncbi:MAG TPA: hypothetical protein PLS67_00255 [Accumulibacter sp.]|nr:hypothetical protein [Accumulibacter sp.]HQC78933.1 hypothetical protein [Accumulibacter sp.]